MIGYCKKQENIVGKRETCRLPAFCSLPKMFTDKSTACGCQCLAVGCLIEDKKSKSKKGRNSAKKKMHFELSPLIVRIALWIVNTYSEFQVSFKVST